jgi:isopentenyl-diphosphate Delta-isomerase
VTLDPGGMETRKRRHIDVCLSAAVDYQTVTTGLERYRLPYNALTQTDLGSVDLATDFLGTRLRAPVLIGSMTGGPSSREPSTATWQWRPSSSASA